jgi:hypothetical protein
VVDYKKLPGWKKLNPITRAEIILVNEGLKPGATSWDPNEELLIKTLERLDIYHGPVKYGQDKVATVDYAKQKPHFDMLEKLDEEVKDIESEIRFWGKFYGYDKYKECCVEKFATDKKHFKTGFPKQVRDLVKKEGKYPEELEYLVPSLTPCEPKCPYVLKILREWKEVLEKHDPDAAEALREYNKERMDGIIKKKKKDYSILKW